MCGRFILTSPLAVVERLLHPIGPILDYPPRYNIAPSQDIPVLRRAAKGDAVELVFMRWGLIPSWSKGPDSRFSMINARAESLADKPAFRQAYRQRRGLVPATGYYEWQTPSGGKRKQPWLIAMPGLSLFFFAGLWESWRNPNGDTILSTTIVTVAASADLRPIHDRMPLAFNSADGKRWLDPATAQERLEILLSPPLVSPFQWRPVSPRVNDPKHDAPDCIASFDGAR